MFKRLFLFLFLGFYFLKSYAVVYTWTGAVNSNWNINNNWSPNTGTPGAGDDVIIVTSANTPLYDGISGGCTNFTLTSGTLDLGGFTFTVSGTTTVFTLGTIQNGTLTVSGATTTSFGNGPIVMNCVTNITSGAITIRNTTFQNTTNITKTGASNDAGYGLNTFNGVTTITNNGTGYWLSTNSAADVYNNTVTFSSTGGRIIPVQNGTNTQFNGNIVINCNSATGSVEIGNNTGTTTFSAGTTISVGTFSDGILQLSRVTQVAGGAALNFTLTGSASCIMGPTTTFTGTFDLIAPSILCNGVVYDNVTNLTKTGTANDNGTGGNTFNNITSITNNGSGYWLSTNTTADIYNSDVTYSSTSGRIIPVENGTNTQFNGNITVNCNSASGSVEIGDNTGTSLFAVGTTIIVGTFSDGTLQLSRITQAMGGAALNLPLTGNSICFIGPSTTLYGALTLSAADIYARGATYNGSVSFTKTGGAANHNNGNLNTFNSTLVINQQSSTYFMLGYNSADAFNDDVTLTCTGSGGIYLGYSGGTGTPIMAATKTLSIGGAGFSTGFLYLGNFTQNGNAAVNLTLTGTSYIQFARNTIIGGDLTVTAPRIYFDNSSFNGFVTANSTGSTNCNCAGGCTFSGNCSFTNSGSQDWNIGNGAADTYSGNVIANNSGSGNLSIGNAGTTNFPGDVTFTNTAAGAANSMSLGNGAASVVTISGDLVINNAATGTGSAYINVAGTGSITVNGTTNISNSATGTDSRIYISESSTSATATFNDDFTFTNTATSTTYSFLRVLRGDVTFNGNVVINNTSTGGSAYNGFFIGWTGAYDGNAILAATKTISVGGSGFNIGSLYLKSFTQVGNTAQNIALTGTATLTIGEAGYPCNFGGDLSFSCSGGTATLVASTFQRIVTGSATGITSTSCQYNTVAGTTSLTQTGAVATTSGGNTINGIATLINSGSSTFRFGVTNPDVFANDLTCTNNGSGSVQLAYNSAGNSFGGDVIMSNSASGTSNVLSICQAGAASTAAITGSLTISNTGSGTDNSILIAETAGTSVTIGGDLTITHASSGSGNNYCYISNNGSTTVTGNTSIANTSAGTNADVFISHSNTAAFFSTGGDLTITNTSTGTGNNRVFLSYTGGTVITGDLTISNASGGTTKSINLAYNNVLSYVTVGGNLSLAISGNASGTNSIDIVRTGGSMTVAGTSSIVNTCNSTAGSTVLFGEAAAGTVTFGNDVVLSNLSTHATGISYFRALYGIFNFNGNVLINNTASTSNVNNGIFIGWPGAYTASATLALTKTISVGGSGFNSGTLYLRNFTQLGNTGQNLTLTGTAALIIGAIGYPSNFGGDLTFSCSGGAATLTASTFQRNLTGSATGLTTTNCQYNTVTGVTSLTQTGGVATTSGGNTVNGTATLINSGSSTYRFGVTNADNFVTNVTCTNNGTGSLDLAYSSVGNIFGGNVVITSSATGATNTISLCTSASATAAVTGDVTFSNSGNATATNLLICNGASAAITIGGSVSYTNSAGTTSTIGIAVGASSSVSITGGLTLSSTGAGTTNTIQLAEGTSSVLNVGTNLLITHASTGTGNNYCYISNNGVTNVTGNVTITNSSGGTNANLYLAHTVTASALNVGGNCIITNTSTASGNNIDYLSYTGDIAITGDLTISNSSSGANSQIVIAQNNTSASLTVGGNLALTISGAGSASNAIYLASNGTASIVGTSSIINTSSGANSGVFMTESNAAASITFGNNVTFSNLSTHVTGDSYFRSTLGTINFNGNLVVNNTAATSSANNGIYLGWSASTLNTTLAATKTISVGVSGFTKGVLQLYKFIQIGNTAQVLTLTGTAALRIGVASGTSNFGGDLTYSCSGGTATSISSTFQRNVTGTATGITTTSCQYNTVAGTTSLTQTGAVATSSGGNTINGAATLLNSGSSTYRFGVTTADNFVSSVSGTNSSSGTNSLELAYSSAGNLFGADVNLTNNATGASNTLSIGMSASATATITGALTINNIGSGTSNYIRIAEGTSATILIGGNLNITHSSTGTSNNYCYISNNGVTTITGNALITNSSSGTNADVRLCETAVASAFNVGGNCTITNTSTATGNNQVLLAYVGDAAITGNLSISNSSSGTTNQIQVSHANASATLTVGGNMDLSLTSAAGTTNDIYVSSTGSCTITGNTTITNNTGGSTGYVRIGEGNNASTATFNGDFTSNCSSTATNSFLRILRGTVTFNGNVTISNTATSGGGNNGFYVGWAGYNGNASIANSKSISVGGAGFTTGILRLYRFTQVGATAQNITLTGTAILSIGTVAEPSTFNGDLTFSVAANSATAATLTGSTFNNSVTGTASSIIITSNTFNSLGGSTSLTKNGSSNNDANGGNIFNGNASFTTTSTGRWRLGTTADDFNGSATFIQSGAGLLQPAYNASSTFEGDISTTGTSTAITFGTGASGRVVVDGSNARFFTGASAQTPIVTRLTMSTAGVGGITLSVPVNISSNITLTDGIITTSSTNYLTMLAGSTASSGDANSYIDGPMRKVGNTAFVFPVGKGGFWARLGMTPVAGYAAATTFSCEYFASSAPEWNNPTYMSAGVTHTSDIEYWDLNRITAAGPTCQVTLYWEDATRSAITDLASLFVAHRWSSDNKWYTHGGSTAGAPPATGSITSTAVLSNFSPTTFGTSASGTVNPLPVELLTFKAEINNDKVDLTWSTLSEINSNYFEVERLNVTNGNYETIGERIHAAGNSNTINNYYQRDASPNRGVNYYRLIQVDNDGSKYISEHVTVNFEPENSNLFSSLNVFPNPVIGSQFSIEFSSGEQQNVLFILRDVLGKEIVSKAVLTNSGNNIYIMSSDNIPAGIYYVIASTDDNLITQRITVK